MSEKQIIRPQTIARLMHIAFGSVSAEADDDTLMRNMVETTGMLMMMVHHKDETYETVVDATAEAILDEHCGGVKRCVATVIESPHGIFVFGDIQGNGTQEERVACHQILADAIINAGWDLHMLEMDAGPGQLIGRSGDEIDLSSVFRKAHERKTERDIAEFKSGMDAALDSWLGGGDSDE